MFMRNLNENKSIDNGEIIFSLIDLIDYNCKFIIVF